MLPSSRDRKGRLVIVALIALPVVLFWIIRTKRVERTGALSVSMTIGEAGVPVYVLAFDQDGKSLLTFTGREIQQWDIQTRKKLQVRPIGAPRSFPPSSLPAISEDAQTILTSDRDERDQFSVKMWDIQTGRQKRSIPASGSMQYLRNMALSANGVLATQNSETPGLNAKRMSYGEQVKIWDAGSGNMLKLIQLPGLTSQSSTTVSCLAVDRDGTFVVAGLQDGRILLWDARTGRKINEWQDGSKDILLSKTANSSFSVTPGVYQVALSPDGQVLATASGDDTVRLWETKTQKLLHTLKTPTGQNHPPLVFSPDSKLLASAGTRTYRSSMGGTGFDAKIWDVASGKIYATLSGNEALIQAFAFSPDGANLASGDSKGTIKLWRIH